MNIIRYKKWQSFQEVDVELNNEVYKRYKSVEQTGRHLRLIFPMAQAYIMHSSDCIDKCFVEINIM